MEAQLTANMGLEDQTNQTKFTFDMQYLYLSAFKYPMLFKKEAMHFEIRVNWHILVRARLNQ